MQISAVKNKYSISFSPKQMSCFTSKLFWNDNLNLKKLLLFLKAEDCSHFVSKG